MKLIIGNKNYSSWSLRAWLLLKHFDIEFEEIRVALYTPESEDTLKQYSKAGKVPVLIDNDLTIWDSLAICEYISEQYLNGRGYPDSVACRAECRSVCAEMHSSFTQIRQYMPMDCRSKKSISINNEVSIEIKYIDELWQNLRNKYGDQGDWLFGQFSIADCFFAPMASRFNTYQPALSAISERYISNIINHPQLKIWYQQSAAETEFINLDEID